MLKVVERIYSIVKRMLVDIDAAFSTQNIELIEHTTSRNMEVDRLYFLAVRQLRGAAMSRRKTR